PRMAPVQRNTARVSRLEVHAGVDRREDLSGRAAGACMGVGCGSSLAANWDPRLLPISKPDRQEPSSPSLPCVRDQGVHEDVAFPGRGKYGLLDWGALWGSARS